MKDDPRYRREDHEYMVECTSIAPSIDQYGEVHPDTKCGLDEGHEGDHMQMEDDDHVMVWLAGDAA